MRILITGGTGSLGSRLTARLSQLGHTVVVLSRNAHRQAELQRQVPDAVFRLGDVADERAVSSAMAGCDAVIHAAAQKRIERGDTDAREYIHTNILGTQNVADVAYRNNVQRAVFISTDKAVAPINMYGATKMVGERLWVHQPSPAFVAIRYGNVVESTGSVWHLWRSQVAAGQPIIVRSPEPTRFIVTIQEAVSYVETALALTSGNCTYVPAPNAFSLWELAAEVQPDDNYWRVTPLLPGEKQHEILLAQGEEAVRCADNLWQVVPGSALAHGPHFQSETANRLTGRRVVELLNGNHR